MAERTTWIQTDIYSILNTHLHLGKRCERRIDTWYVPVDVTLGGVLQVGRGEVSAIILS